MHFMWILVEAVLIQNKKTTKFLAENVFHKQEAYGYKMHKKSLTGTYILHSLFLFQFFQIYPQLCKTTTIPFKPSIGTSLHHITRENAVGGHGKTREKNLHRKPTGSF